VPLRGRGNSDGGVGDSYLRLSRGRKDCKNSLLLLVKKDDKELDQEKNAPECEKVLGKEKGHYVEQKVSCGNEGSQMLLKGRTRKVGSDGAGSSVPCRKRIKKGGVEK